MLGSSSCKAKVTNNTVSCKARQQSRALRSVQYRMDAHSAHSRVDTSKEFSKDGVSAKELKDGDDKTLAVSPDDDEEEEP